MWERFTSFPKKMVTCAKECLTYSILMQRWLSIKFICKTKHYSLYGESLKLYFWWKPCGQLKKTKTKHQKQTKNTSKNFKSPDGEWSLMIPSTTRGCLPLLTIYYLQRHCECLENWLGYTEISKQALWKMEWLLVLRFTVSSVWQAVLLSVCFVQLLVGNADTESLSYGTLKKLWAFQLH